MKKLYYMFLFIMLILIVVPEKSTVSLVGITNKEVTVEIKGEIDNPGVYTLERGANIQQLLDMAGVKQEADLSSLNLTETLGNHDVIVIPIQTEQEKISINSASIEQLITIPSIGEKTAEKIIEYRQNHGPFQTIEDLMNVKGIGEKKLERIREYICL